ncbi:MAG: sulfotransferase domain-containing protein [gamma proteobacterium symbiont of Bathyaustriella thionipta]|nr:sulfotransferase domain-containing protein [gamma proteobacterium symbiont of Bathyaustriella thionipta]MCU7949286.1 sulfotransferase domain-containing protein [gamma proteobacterium symbiont of Bathyaustriella thionipta]MCU7954000.1 sulfotransferase domain-containing protein [gamma proteobacterium symbiont of Bathyaustriella thionipta]MCU7955889.1 sulfotransferase domain-containing protein [gamma proteobacterium symbiont of Bathyaustriella thionipta]MCU7966389.1 sulfotransferase domain-cont
MHSIFLSRAKVKFKKITMQLQPVHRPDFMIIGAQKAGTTSLYNYLKQHPMIVGSYPKETHYFDRDIHFNKSLTSYEKHFVGWGKKKYFESTPSYLYSPGTCEAIHNAYSELNIIIVLREPIKRAYSAWNMYKDFFEKGLVERVIKSKPQREGKLLYKKFYEGRDVFPSFRECIDIELDLIESGMGYEPALLRRGLYLEQLNPYWNSFGKENILILGFKELIKDTENTLKKVTGFLDIEDIGWSFLNTTPYNARSYKEQITESDNQLLKDFYLKPNQELLGAIGHINW